jgi:phosphoribosylformylglycinamidine cyclo-ligase
VAESMKYDVDIDSANQAKKDMKESLASKNSRLLHRDGAFSALYNINFPEYKNPVMVLKTEEPGSKQLLAFQEDKVEGVCYDMINHLINDCIVMGAKPLSIQDAIITGKMDQKIIGRVVKAIADACREQDCDLTGGETSEQPGVLPEGTYILTSSIVGIVEQADIIDGSKIKAGDVVLNMESSGLHTNGYTLVRKLLATYPEIKHQDIAGKTFIEEILTPHRCYYKALKELFPQKVFTGLAHITGGGIKENLDRILPDDKDAVIAADKYDILPIFKFVKKKGNVSEADMLRTFNLGVGLAATVKPENAGKVIAHMEAQGIRTYPIGVIREGSRQVEITGQFNWE